MMRRVGVGQLAEYSPGPEEPKHPGSAGLRCITLAAADEGAFWPAASPGHPPPGAGVSQPEHGCRDPAASFSRGRSFGRANRAQPSPSALPCITSVLACAPAACQLREGRQSGWRAWTWACLGAAPVLLTGFAAATVMRAGYFAAMLIAGRLAARVGWQVLAAGAMPTGPRNPRACCCQGWRWLNLRSAWCW